MQQTEGKTFALIRFEYLEKFCGWWAVPWRIPQSWLLPKVGTAYPTLLKLVQGLSPKFRCNAITCSSRHIN